MIGRRKLLGILVLVAVIVIASGATASTTSNRVPESNAGSQTLKVRIVIPPPAAPTSDTGDEVLEDADSSIDALTITEESKLE